MVREMAPNVIAMLATHVVTVQYAVAANVLALIVWVSGADGKKSVAHPSERDRLC